MIVEESKKSLLEFPFEEYAADISRVVLLNPTNLTGIMGKGLALWFKQWCPPMAHMYRYLCDTKELLAGDVFFWVHHGPTIACVPTKHHWREDADEYLIRSSMESLGLYLKKFSDKEDMSDIHVVTSHIGAGLGKLDWETVVKPIFEETPYPVHVYTGFMDPADVKSTAVLTEASYITVSPRILRKYTQTYGDNIELVDT